MISAVTATWKRSWSSSPLQRREWWTLPPAQDSRSIWRVDRFPASLPEASGLVKLTIWRAEYLNSSPFQLFSHRMYRLQGDQVNYTTHDPLISVHKNQPLTSSHRCSRGRILLCHLPPSSESGNDEANSQSPSPRNKVFRWPVIISWTSAQHLPKLVCPSSKILAAPDLYKQLPLHKVILARW